MEAFAEILHHILAIAVEYGVLIFEFAGVIVLFITGIRGIYNYVTKNPTTRLQLAKGMGMGLEFKLGSEILRTVTADNFRSIGLIACIFALRAVMTFLLHWETTHEEEEGEDGIEKKQYHIHEPHR